MDGDRAAPVKSSTTLAAVTSSPVGFHWKTIESSGKSEPLASATAREGEEEDTTLVSGGCGKQWRRGRAEPYASAAATADYQGEVGVAYGQGEANSTDNDVVAFGGRYNFEMVDTSKGPQAEAAFLDKSSSAGLYYLSTEPDAAGADDEDDIGVDVRVVTADNLIIEAAYSQFDDGSDDADTVSIGVGTYLNDTTDIVVTYSTTDADLVDIDALNLDLHSVMKLQGTASLAYDLGASYIDAEDDDGYVDHGKHEPR